MGMMTEPEVWRNAQLVTPRGPMVAWNFRMQRRVRVVVHPVPFRFGRAADDLADVRTGTQDGQLTAASLEIPASMEVVDLLDIAIDDEQARERVIEAGAIKSVGESDFSDRARSRSHEPSREALEDAVDELHGCSGQCTVA
jgi:hypothetical protein